VAARTGTQAAFGVKGAYTFLDAFGYHLALRVWAHVIHVSSYYPKSFHKSRETTAFHRAHCDNTFMTFASPYMVILAAMLVLMPISRLLEGEPAPHRSAGARQDDHHGKGDGRYYEVIGAGADSLIVVQVDTGAVLTVQVGPNAVVESTAGDDHGTTPVRLSTPLPTGVQPGDTVHLKKGRRTEIPLPCTPPALSSCRTSGAQNRARGALWHE